MWPMCRWNHPILVKDKGITKRDKSIVICDVGIAQCDDGTIRICAL